jgi:hypothetical protein
MYASYSSIIRGLESLSLPVCRSYIGDTGSIHRDVSRYIVSIVLVRTLVLLIVCDSSASVPNTIVVIYNRRKHQASRPNVPKHQGRKIQNPVTSMHKSLKQQYHSHPSLSPATARARATTQIYTAAQAIHARPKRARARTSPTLAFFLGVFGRETARAGEQVQDVGQADNTSQTPAHVLPWQDCGADGSTWANACD